MLTGLSRIIVSCLYRFVGSKLHCFYDVGHHCFHVISKGWAFLLLFTQDIHQDIGSSFRLTCNSVS